MSGETGTRLVYDEAALRAWLAASGGAATATQAQSLAVACGLMADIALAPMDYVVPAAAGGDGYRLPVNAAGEVVVGLHATRERLLALGEPTGSGLTAEEAYQRHLPLALFWAASRPVPVRAGTGAERGAGWVVPAAIAVGAIAAAVVAWRAADAVEVREATRVRAIEAAAQAATERNARVLRTGRAEAPGPVEAGAGAVVAEAAHDGWVDLSRSVERAGRGLGMVLLGGAALWAVTKLGGGK